MVELYWRLKLNVDLCEELGVSIYSFPMKYHPITDPKYCSNRDYIGKNWNRKYIRTIQAILNSTKGKVGKESMEAMKNALSIYNLGISPEVRANLTQASVAVSNAMKTVNQLDFSGLYEAVSRFAEVSKMVQPASENARKLAALISDELKISIESANKSANSDEKSANKSADNMTVLTKRQEQILTIMEEGREYTTEAIAGIIGLKGPRTRQLMNELVELGKVESLGTTKDRRYRKK